MLIKFWINSRSIDEKSIYSHREYDHFSCKSACFFSDNKWSFSVGLQKKVNRGDIYWWCVVFLSSLLCFSKIRLICQFDWSKLLVLFVTIVILSIAIWLSAGKCHAPQNHTQLAAKQITRVTVKYRWYCTWQITNYALSRGYRILFIFRNAKELLIYTLPPIIFTEPRDTVQS